MDVFVSSDYEQKQGGKIAGKSEDLSKHCWCRSRQRGMKLRLYYCMDYVKEWKSVTVELDESIDDIQYDRIEMLVINLLYFVYFLQFI